MPSLWRRWRVPRISTYYGSSGLSKPVCPHHLRSLSTETSGRAPTQRPAICSPRNALALALSGALLGLGYYIGAQSNSLSAADGSARRQPTPKPVYGTPEDFARAIEELRASFVGEAVTTAPDQLAAHGFSPNSHHPGMPLLLHSGY